jgi:hypothetical protein
MAPDAPVSMGLAMYLPSSSRISLTMMKVRSKVCLLDVTMLPIASGPATGRVRAASAALAGGGNILFGGGTLQFTASNTLVVSWPAPAVVPAAVPPAAADAPLAPAATAATATAAAAGTPR